MRYAERGTRGGYTESDGGHKGRDGLLPQNLDDDALLPAAVELGVEHLLPRTQVERAAGDRQDHLVMDERALQVGVRVVLPGLVVAVVSRGGETLEPLHHVVLQAALLVVHPDPRGDLHPPDEP